MQHNILFLQFINYVIEKADSPFALDVSNKLEVNTSSPPSFSIHFQETSMVSLSLFHCTCKESNVDSDSPCQELSTSPDMDTTDSCLSDSPMEEGSEGKWAALSNVSLEQFDDGMEYVVLELQEEVVEKYSLVMSTKEFQPPP